MMAILGRRLLIRPATAADADILAAVSAASWRASYRGLVPPDALASLDENSWAAWFRSQHGPGRTTLVAFKRDEAVGLVSFGPDREDAAYGEIYAIDVLPRSQGRGVGRKLLDAALAALESRDVRVWCVEGNPRARSRYTRRGFVVDGIGTYEIAGHIVPTVRYSLRR